MAEKGREILISVNDAGVWKTVGCMRTQSISINNEEVDISSTCSLEEWRTLLEGAGIRTANMTGNGMFSSGEGQTYMVNAALTGSIEEMRMFVPGLGTFQGDYLPATVEVTGEYNGAVQFNGSFSSAGQIVFTAV